MTLLKTIHIFTLFQFRNVGGILESAAHWQLMGYLVTPCDPHILLHSFDGAMNHG